MATKQYTRAEVANFNKKDSTFFIIDNVVYDVHKFLDEHPGGHEVLLNVAGRDASEDFDDVGHSFDAKDLMKKFIVGEVVEAERVNLEKRSKTWVATNTENETSFFSSWKFPVLLGVVVTLLYTYLFG